MSLLENMRVEALVDSKTSGLQRFEQGYRFNQVSGGQGGGILLYSARWVGEPQESHLVQLARDGGLLWSAPLASP